METATTFLPESEHNHTNISSTSLFSPILRSHPSLWMRIMGLFIGAFLLTFGGISNVTVFAAFVRERKHLWRRQNFNIIGLAVADAIICTYVALNIIVEYGWGRWVAPQVLCEIHWAITSLAYYGSLHMLTLVGYDRYLIVKLGVDYKRIETWPKIIARSFLYGLFEPALFTPIYFLNYFTGFSVNVSEGCFVEIYQLGFFYPIIAVVALCHPIGSMTYFYVKVYRYATSKEAKTNLPNKPQQQQQQQTWSSKKTTTTKVNVIVIPATVVPTAAAATHKAMRPNAAASTRHTRVTKILKYLYASLVICYGPYFVCTLILLLVMCGALPTWDVEWWAHVHELFQVAGLINNAVNPILYAFTMPKIRDAMTKVWVDAAVWLRFRKLH